MRGRDKRVHALVRKPERKRLFIKCSRRWEDNIKVDRKELGGRVVHWIYLAQIGPIWICFKNTK
jgi:hypothetical protein